MIVIIEKCERPICLLIYIKIVQNDKMVGLLLIKLKRDAITIK